MPGRGKTHFLAALGRELILRHRYPVLFTPTFKLVQQLLAAKKELALAASSGLDGIPGPANGQVLGYGPSGEVSD